MPRILEGSLQGTCWKMECKRACRGVSMTSLRKTQLCCSRRYRAVRQHPSPTSTVSFQVNAPQYSLRSPCSVVSHHGQSLSLWDRCCHLCVLFIYADGSSSLMHNPLQICWLSSAAVRSALCWSCYTQCNREAESRLQAQSRGSGLLQSSWTLPSCCTTTCWQLAGLSSC